MKKGLNASFSLYDILEIKWVDSQSYNNWHDQEKKLDDTCECRSVGYFLKTTGVFIVICQSISPDEYGDILQIPKVAIINIRKIKNASRSL